MGLLSTLGKVGGFFLGGPAGSAIGGAIGGAVDDRKAAKDFNRVEADKFVRLRAAAEKGGIHPLEALRAGQQVGARTGRIVTSLAANNAYDALADELTGEAAKQRKREQVEDEIRERELERLVQSQINTPTVGGNRPPRLPTNQNPNYPADLTRASGSVLPDDPSVPSYIRDGFMNPDGTRREVVGVPRRDESPSTLTKGNNETINMPPEFPGIDEIAGWGISAGPQRWARRNPETNEMIRQGAETFADSPEANSQSRYLPPFTGMIVHGIDEIYETFGVKKK